MLAEVAGVLELEDGDLGTAVSGFGEGWVADFEAVARQGLGLLVLDLVAEADYSILEILVGNLAKENGICK